jgi:hypothetical protein
MATFADMTTWTDKLGRTVLTFTDSLKIVDEQLMARVFVEDSDDLPASEKRVAVRLS